MTPADPLPLRELYVYLVQGCNMACRHCWLAPAADDEGRSGLPVEQLEQAIEEALPLGLEAIKLSGGEPLLHPEFGSVLETIRRAGISLSLETNGSLCTPELAEGIAGLPDASVAVSLDGVDAATHDRVRRREGSFAAACRGVRSLADAGCPPQIIMTLMRCNVDQIEAMIALADELGARALKLNVVQPVSRGGRIRGADDELGVAELIETGRLVDRQLAPQTELRVLLDLPPAFIPLSRIATDVGCSTCAIHSVLGVLATGHWALCGIGELIPELVFGTIGSTPLADVWHRNAILASLRAGLPGRLEGICGRCVMKNICLGSCVAVNYYRSGSLFAPFWFCTEAEGLGLFPSSRLITPGGAEADRG